MNQHKDETESRTKTRPAHEIRYGFIRATIWRNETQNGSMFKVTVSRSYKTKDADGKDVLRDTNSLDRDDLLIAAKAVVEAHTWIWAQD